EYEDSDVETKSIGISQTIDWGDQRGSRTAIADAELVKAMADYEVANQSFISELLTGLAEHQTNSELAVLNRQSLKLMDDFKRIAEQRYQAGDLNQVELNLARLAYSQAIMEQATVLSDATQARENLRSLLGDLPSKLPELPEQLPEPEINQELESFLQKLPVIRAQLAELQVAKQNVELRKSEKAWNPTISVKAGTEGDDDLIGLNLSLPLNIRNNFGAEVDAAQQQLIASEQRAHLAYRNSRASLIVTTERYRNLLNAWNNWREYSRESVNQQLNLIKQLWQAGDISAADYLLQLKQALETQAAGLELRNQLWQVAFNWMSQTNTIDIWLNITQPEKNN
ncbi:MAG: TolC family protein, partial [Woeseiaceae bacterium]